MTQLSTHFSLRELTASETADRDGIDNTPTPEALANLHTLAATLEKVRAIWFNQRAIHVANGYRSPELNARVGGVPNSDHMLGYAADFHVDGLSDKEAALAIAASSVKFDQLILEPGRCVHLSINPRMRGQRLTQPGGPGTAVHEGIG